MLIDINETSRGDIFYHYTITIVFLMKHSYKYIFHSCLDMLYYVHVFKKQNIIFRRIIISSHQLKYIYVSTSPMIIIVASHILIKHTSFTFRVL